ncbi:MAG: histidine kinase dimerization/phospho-acceptor domain-containing protein, partial [Reinekea sp.]|nr:histidine kinase dimerization/phospho-acceptor domain-containing protein [Reinekea sp.]
MEFNELSATELIEAISGLSGVILQIHKDFRPIFVTKDYARLYGFDSTEQFLKLGSIMDLIPEDARDLAIKRYQQIIRTGMGDTLTLKTQRVDGTGIWVRIQDRRLKYGDDGYCVMTVLIDITDEVELKQKYEEIAAAEHEARSELERVQGLTIEREKQSALTQLLAGVSHQLNTPLGNIRTSSTTVEKILNETLVKLRDKSLRESDLVNAMSEALEAMHVIDKSVVKANRLIKNVKFMVSDQTDADPVRFRFQPI